LQRDRLIAIDPQGWVGLTADGKKALAVLQAARRELLAELLKGWSPYEHPEVQTLLTRLAQAFGTAPPRQVASS
jgi:hypothetical protein